MAFCPQCGTSVTAGSRYCATCGTAVVDDGSPTVRASRPSAESIAVGERRLLDTLRQLTLGEYEILGELGRGGMAVVFLAHDIGLDRRVAIKVMAPALALMDPEIQDRFKREARTAAALSHPNIIPVYGVREGRDLVYFIMKYVAGRSLESVIKEAGPLPIPMVQTVLAQAGSALGHAHRHGVVHRDVKPGNIMLDEDGWVVVTDFGIAKVAEQQALTLTGGVVGTPAYMSPEQCAGQDITGAADQYALGIVAYEMIAGRTPFVGGSMVKLMYDHCHEAPPPIVRLRPECPPAVADAVMRMLEKEPAKRFPGIEHAVAAVGSVSDSQSGIVRTQLVTLAKQSPAGELIVRFQTPRSPVPRSGGRAAPDDARTDATPLPDVRAPGRRRLRLLLGAMGVILLSATGWMLLDRGTSQPGVAQATPADSEPATVAPAEVTALAISPLAAVLEVGEALEFTVTASGADGAILPDAPITWEIGDSTIASIESHGRVTALAPGATGVAAHAGFASSSVVLTVREPSPKAPSTATEAPRATSVRLDPASGSVTAGAALQLSATVTDQRGRPMPDRSVRWSSTDPNVATVSADGRARGVAEGRTTIVAESDGVTARAAIVVTAVPVATVEIAPNRETLAVGSSLQLVAGVRDASGVALEGRTVVWESSDRSVATVSASGLVRAQGPGTATITGASGGASAVAHVTVSAPAPVAPPVDTRAEVERLLEQFRLAIESSDIERLRQAYPGMTAAEEGSWQTFFANASDLSATFRILAIDTRPQAASATVEATYVFRSDRQQRQTVTLTASFERGPDGWRLTAIH